MQGKGNTNFEHDPSIGDGHQWITNWVVHTQHRVRDGRAKVQITKQTSRQVETEAQQDAQCSGEEHSLYRWLVLLPHNLQCVNLGDVTKHENR